VTNRDVIGSRDLFQYIHKSKWM